MWFKWLCIVAECYWFGMVVAFGCLIIALLTGFCAFASCWVGLVGVLIILYWLILLMLPAYWLWLTYILFFAVCLGFCGLGLVIVSLFVVVIA